MIRPVVKEWCGNTRGATAIEYSLLAAAVALVIIALVFSIGDTLNGYLQPLSDFFSGP